jgi:hypothetical protein
MRLLSRRIIHSGSQPVHSISRRAGIHLFSKAVIRQRSRRAIHLRPHSRQAIHLPSKGIRCHQERQERVSSQQEPDSPLIPNMLISSKFNRRQPLLACRERLPDLMPRGSGAS